MTEEDIDFGTEEEANDFCEELNLIRQTEGDEAVREFLRKEAIKRIHGWFFLPEVTSAGKKHIH
jgi:hypothetical protein